MAPSPPLTALLALLLAAPLHAGDDPEADAELERLQREYGGGCYMGVCPKTPGGSVNDRAGEETEGVIERDDDRIIDTDTSLRDDPDEEARLREKHRVENDAMLKAGVDFTDRTAVRAFLDEFRRTGKAPQKTPPPAPPKKEDKKTAAVNAPGATPVRPPAAKDEPAVEEPQASQEEKGPQVRAGEVSAIDGEAPKAKDDHDQAGKLRAQAFTKATSMGEALKRSLSQGPGDMPEGAGGIGAAGLEGRGGIDPADPRDKAELLAAARSGFKTSFSALGLEAKPTGGGLDILRQDGTPATAADLAALKARIKEEPRALMRHPDLYEHLPREKFLQLKDDYAAGAKPEAFKHIALQDRRDFVRSSSCDSISGGCNLFAKASYKVGDDVPPKELKKIHAYIHEGSDSDERFAVEDDGPPPEALKPAHAPKRGLGKAGFRPIYARLNQVINAIQDFIGTKPEGGKGASASSPALATPIAVSFSAKREPMQFSPKPARAPTEVTYPQEYGNRTPVNKSPGTRPLRVPASGLGLGIGLLGALALWRARR